MRFNNNKLLFTIIIYLIIDKIFNFRYVMKLQHYTKKKKNVINSESY